jgi:TetR/AcrR family transcriptional regulator, cholesterol catabolism regulator
MSVQPDPIARLTASAATSPSPRRMLSARQASRLDRLVEAAVDELHERGYEGLTIRAVATRCGVAAATAYTYFASKDHLVAEIFWRRLCALPEVETPGSAEDAVVDVLKSTVSIVADDPPVGAACTVAILAQDPEASALRGMIGAELIRRIDHALGDDGTPELQADLVTHWAGAFLVAGMGYATFDETMESLDRGARALMRGFR